MYGGADVKFPANHKVGMQVPLGGSMCANCEYLGKEGVTCANEFFVKWNHGDENLPLPANQYCCDFFNSAKLLRKPK